MPPTSARTTRKITDPAVLKALAHPLRLRLYELLSARGPATATQLGEHVDEAAGLLSYHLRQLAEHGYVEEAPELATDGRERWWRVVPGGISWSTADFLGEPGGRAVAGTAERMLLGRQLDRLQQYTERQEAWGPDWVDAAIGTDALLRLTPDELRAFGADLQAVISRWASRDLPADAADAAAAADGTERADVFAFVHAFPFHP
jgi:DNA-binding transcriptional ArsR family regulator